MTPPFIDPMAGISARLARLAETLGRQKAEARQQQAIETISQFFAGPTGEPAQAADVAGVTQPTVDVKIVAPSGKEGDQGKATITQAKDGNKITIQGTAAQAAEFMRGRGPQQAPQQQAIPQITPEVVEAAALLGIDPSRLQQFQAIQGLTPEQKMRALTGLDPEMRALQIQNLQQQAELRTQQIAMGSLGVDAAQQRAQIVAKLPADERRQFLLTGQLPDYRTAQMIKRAASDPNDLEARYYMVTQRPEFARIWWPEAFQTGGRDALPLHGATINFWQKQFANVAGRAFTDQELVDIVRNGSNYPDLVATIEENLKAKLDPGVLELQNELLDEFDRYAAAQADLIQAQSGRDPISAQAASRLMTDITQNIVQRMKVNGMIPSTAQVDISVDAQRGSLFFGRRKDYRPVVTVNGEETNLTSLVSAMPSSVFGENQAIAEWAKTARATLDEQTGANQIVQPIGAVIQGAAIEDELKTEISNAATVLYAQAGEEGLRQMLVAVTEQYGTAVAATVEQALLQGGYLTPVAEFPQ